MTTIMVHENCIAADSQVSRGTMVDDTNFNKLIRIPEGWLGVAGCCHDLRILQGYLGGVIEELPHELNVEGLILMDKGGANRVSVQNGIMVVDKVKQPYSVGSGSGYAIAAARAGASIKEAVKIAISLDALSGGTVKVKKRGDKK
jgi:ATP-dependent protease HslVU (ClpYQ) peptidase subunit